MRNEKIMMRDTTSMSNMNICRKLHAGGMETRYTRKTKLEVYVLKSYLSLDVFAIEPFLLEPYYSYVTLHLIM